MNLKSTLKTVKLYESTISMILGAVVLAVAAFLVFSYFRNLKVGETTQNGTSKVNLETYTIQNGDTLWSISENYYGTGFEWQRLMSTNSISNPKNLKEGTEITIPEIEDVQKVAVNEDDFLKENSKEKGVSQTILENTYTVVQGDNLWKIAVRLYGDGYKWIEIAKSNNLSNPDLIHPGNALKIPKSG